MIDPFTGCRTRRRCNKQYNDSSAIFTDDRQGFGFYCRCAAAAWHTVHTIGCKSWTWKVPESNFTIDTEPTYLATQLPTYARLRAMHHVHMHVPLHCTCIRAFVSIPPALNCLYYFYSLHITPVHFISLSSRRRIVNSYSKLRAILAQPAGRSQAYTISRVAPWRKRKLHTFGTAVVFSLPARDVRRRTWNHI